MKRVTLKNLSECTAQEVFDWVTINLLKQGRKSVDGEQCRYRTVLQDGTKLKCAAGWLMLESEYKKRMDDSNESTSWESLVDDDVVPSTQHTELICDLQDIHDGWATLKWRNQFAKLAEDYDLEFNPKKK